MADNDVVFQEAVDALRVGNKSRARELLTELLKTDQNNATYWVWMSATVDTTKERIYCLQTAYKLDPNNASAKRGLILHGVLPADETVQPFSINRPRVWEEKLLLAHEKPKLKGWAAVRASPVARLGGFAALGAVLIGALVFGFLQARAIRNARPPTATPGPSPTFTLTPTSFNVTGQAPAEGTPAPLSALVEVPYTATPLYVSAVRSPLTGDYYLRFSSSFNNEKWDDAIAALDEIIKLEPSALYAYYYKGEASRFKGDYSGAIAAYQSALGVDLEFGPAYVGMARATRAQNPSGNVLSLLDDAIRFDPNFGEAYLERAIVKLRDNDIPGALADLGEADSRLPNSPLVYFYLAQSHLRAGDLERAQAAAQHAYELDVTYLPTYLLLGQIYAEAGKETQALQALETYLQYSEDDTAAYILRGKMYFNDQEYEKTVADMTNALRQNRNQIEAYLYRFLSNVELGNGDQAEEDLA